MLECLEQSAGLTNDKSAISLAVWFLDVFYEVRAKPGTNEEARAEFLEHLATDDSVSAAAAMIRHSSHHGKNDDGDTKLFCDLDLYRLGVSSEAFSRHGQDIRIEYRYLTETEWTAGRSGFLKQVLERQTIFQTDFWYLQCENQARANIAGALSKLSP